jgi:hypothetical protein
VTRHPAPPPGGRNGAQSRPSSAAARPGSTIAEPVLAQEIWAQMSGLQVLQGQIAGELPRPLIHYLPDRGTLVRDVVAPRNGSSRCGTVAARQIERRSQR